MTYDQLVTTSSKDEPQLTNNETAMCLYLCKDGDWQAAHDIVESLPEPGASWIHAMLHREEGDLSNAGYWYARAGKKMPDRSLSISDEWHQIAQALLR